jgi:hypothetical protein
VKYLGVPVSQSRIHIKDWLHLEEKNAKRLDTRKGGTMSIAGRNTLMNSTLTNKHLSYLYLYAA